MNAKVVNVTPELANSILKTNSLNRDINQRHVNFLVSQMNEGYWFENGEPIITSNEGKLLDGQHRLMAIVKSGKTFRIPIINGIDENAMKTIDTGRGRTLPDLLSMKNLKYKTEIASIVRGVIAYDNGSISGAIKDGNNPRNQYIHSNAYHIEDFEKRRDMYETLLDFSLKYYSLQTYPIHKKKELGVYAYIFTNGDVAKLENQTLVSFFKKLCGITVHEKSSVRIFNKILIRNKEQHLTLSFKQKMALLIKCWNFHVDGNDIIKVLRYVPGSEKYPEPIKL